MIKYLPALRKNVEQHKEAMTQWETTKFSHYTQRSALWAKITY